MKTQVALFLLLYLAVMQLPAQAPSKKLSLKDVWSNRDLRAKRPAALESMKDGEHYMVKKSDSLNVYDYLTGSLSRVIFTQADFIRKTKGDTLSPDSYSLSKDESKLLFSTETEPIYRRSSKANYYVMDLATKMITEVSPNGKQRLADFSPDGNRVAFIRDNNIFVKDLSSGVEKQITTDGKTNSIINGATDWVYEEEFEFSKAFFWSPDGSKIAYYRFDESNVKEYIMEMWGELYPEAHHYKYPKAGEANSVIGILVYDLASGSAKTMDIGSETDIYIPRIKWTKQAGQLCIYRMNRHQNKLELLSADVSTGSVKVIYTEENKCYIEINDHLTFTDDGKFFLLTSEKDGNRHIYLYSTDGRVKRQITHGNWEVDELLGIDQVKRVIYFSSTESSPLDRDIYSINLDGTRKKKLSKARGWNTASFSSNFKYYVYSWQDINHPPVYSVMEIKGGELRKIEENNKLAGTLKDYGFGEVSFFTFTLPDGVALNGYMLRPIDFDSTIKYPVLMNVYGGPGSQGVQNRWGGFDFIWYQYLAQQGILSVSVDNRGTGGRGEEFKKCTYLEMGKLETEDQVEAAKYLSGLPFVDGGRIGIWGWSYGGFMSSLCITKGADYFKSAIAVAPVTNWRYYDNIYTERFMRTPAENPSGYDDNSPIKYAKDLKGKFLMVHGTADDNVHLQNSVEFSDALIKANKQFEVFYYPNRNHGIYGGNSRQHLYQMMTDFWTKNL